MYKFLHLIQLTLSRLREWLESGFLMVVAYDVDVHVAAAAPGVDPAAPGSTSAATLGVVGVGTAALAPAPEPVLLAAAVVVVASESSLNCIESQKNKLKRAFCFDQI